jgi:hypothetical protein
MCCLLLTDSPPDWNQGQNPPPRMASPPPQEHKQEPNWLEPKRSKKFYDTATHLCHIIN